MNVGEMQRKLSVWLTKLRLSLTDRGRAGCAERVRRGAHRANTPRSGAKFRADDFEANASPESERRTEQEHGIKAGNTRRRVWCRPATPERYG